MEIMTNTTWTIAKDGQALHLTLEDIEHLLSHLADAGVLLVFDEESRCCGSDIGVSTNGNGIQITLFKEERT